MATDAYVMKDDTAIDPALTEPFEIHRRSWLFAAVAAIAMVLALAYFWFAFDQSSWLLAVVGVVLAAISAAFIPSLRDFGAPLLVADLHGVRLQGREGWIGLLWNEIESFRIVRRDGLRGAEVQIAAEHAPEVYLVPLGIATNMSPARAEVELAKRRSAAPY